MADRLYLMPLVLDARNRRVPKYHADFAGLSWAAQDYGPEPWCLVGVRAIPDALHTTISADADVNAFPLLANFGNQIGGNLAAVQAAMENAAIPAGWVAATMTWNTLFRGVLLIFQFNQRFNGLMPNVRLFDPNDNITLSTLMRNLPAGVWDALKQTARSFGIDTTSVGPDGTMRDFYQVVRQNFPNITMTFFGQTW